MKKSYYKTISFGFGHGEQLVKIASDNLLDVLTANKVDVPFDETLIIRQALENPIGAIPLHEIELDGKSIAIITSDITRPCPTAKLMPLLLDALYAGGAKKENISLVFALGCHRHHSMEEQKMLAGTRAWEEVRCVDSNPDDCVYMGRTKRGTPVNITRVVAEADIRICIGNIEYHYFAGYSGGAKAIMPGVSNREAIQSNHSIMVDENACTGKLEGNPLRKDLEEAADICGVDFILNVVLDEHKKILYAVAGHVKEAHRRGCQRLDSIYCKYISEKADIILVGQGGAPKDLNLYQTHKALEIAKVAVKDGGIIILIGSCKEGFGESVFQQWMEEANTPDELIERIQSSFQLGGHKAAAIAMVLQYADIFLVSEMADDVVEQCFMRPFHSVQDAFDAAIEKLGADATVLAMPYAGTTFPKL
ncbi:MAG: nickel-dependent lactate racemase [Clostridiales bacterium]|nr:nickel-dependent lactate racemase [Clostridiales bacterium]